MVCIFSSPVALSVSCGSYLLFVTWLFMYSRSSCWCQRTLLLANGTGCIFTNLLECLIVYISSCQPVRLSFVLTSFSRRRRHVCKSMNDTPPWMWVCLHTRRSSYLSTTQSWGLGPDSTRWFLIYSGLVTLLPAAGWHAVTGPSSSNQPVNLSRADRYVGTGTCHHSTIITGSLHVKWGICPKFIARTLQVHWCVFTLFCSTDGFYFWFLVHFHLCI